MKQIQCFGVIITLIWGTTNAIPQSNIQSVPERVTHSEAYKHSNSVYDEFRAKYPLHFQCVGKSEYSDKSCLFLISEPSPAVTENAIRKVFGSNDYSLQIKQQKLGYDGYIKDVIIAVSSVTHDQVINLEKSLHKLLFCSDYKAERATLHLPVSEGRIFFTSKNLNYQISLAELYNWFIEKKELFLTPNNQRVTVSTLLSNSRGGVYLSENPGFVAWVINKNEDLSTQKSAIRKFSLDSDLLLGAFSNSQRLVIIGRERESSLSELPPLCIETILMLASCSQSQLSQSLDIMDILAGKITSRSVDWCPTFLSNELENTEYGDLLTITDLLLKGWSESGRMRNLDINYPAPSRYPFYKHLSGILQDKKMQSMSTTGVDMNLDSSVSLVYNWNTDGAIYSLKVPDYSIYAITSTGALPVSYFNDQYSGVSIGKEYEKEAYEYFASINNTDLARVVQYQTLYSLFFDNRIYSHTNALSDKTETHKPYLLMDWMKTLLTRIRDTSPEDFLQIAHTTADQLVREGMKENIATEKDKQTREFEASIQAEIKRSGLSSSDSRIVQWEKDNWAAFEADLNQQIEQSVSINVQSMESYIVQHMTNVQKALKEMNSVEFIKVYKYLSYPRGESIARFIDTQKMRTLMEGLRGMAIETNKEVYKSFGVDLAQVMDYYSQALSSESSLWIKTPTLTRTFEGYHAVGGHNLLASMKRVKSLTEYVPRFNRANLQINVRPREEIIPSISRVHRGL